MGVILQPVIANDLPEIAPRNDGRVKIRQSQLYSRLQHALLSAYGSRWAERNLVMFTVYIDDSGTDPKQAVAVAAALIVPAIQIPILEKNWAEFALKYGFPDFHASECVARNPHSAFAGWSDEKVRHALSRARQIMKKHTSQAFTFTIHKEDFDAEAKPEWRKVGGQNHFTWAFRNVLIQILRWADERKITVPFEYVFDWADKPERDEIEMVMAQFEGGHPGKFDGHFIFKKRKEVPALQCVDLLAWSAFSMSRKMFRDVPMQEIAKESFRDFSNHINRDWLHALTHTREALHLSVSRDLADAEGEQRRKEWYRNYTAELAQKKNRKTK